MTKITGNDSNEARFIVSCTSPVLEEPSPKNAKPTAARPNRRCESVIPETADSIAPR
jgi:hypothetical protein